MMISKHREKRLTDRNQKPISGLDILVFYMTSFLTDNTYHLIYDFDALCDRFLHGYRNMASSSIVNGKELGEPERRPLNPSAKGFIISLGKHSAISQGTKDIEKSNTDTMNKFITHCSRNGAEDGRTSSGNVISGYEGVCGTTFGVIDNKADTTGEIVDVTGCELSSGDKESLAAGVPQLIVYPIEDGVPPMEILPNSSHCDGSIYRGTDCWKKEYHIADRNESKWSISFSYFYSLLGRFPSYRVN